MSNTNQSFEEDTDTGVSPVIGVILMVAITVILSAVIGVFVLSIGDVGETASAGVSVDEDPEDGVVVRLTDSGNTNELIIEKNGSEESRLTNVGESTTVAVSSGDTVSVIGVTEDGTQSVIQNYTATQDLGSVVPANVSGTVSYNPPAEGVTVTALDDSGSVVGQDTTDAQGNFSVPQTGNYEVNGYTVATTVSSGTDVELDTSDVTKNGDNIAKVLMEGDGSSTDPYKVNSAADLQAMKEGASGDEYQVNADIDASHTENWNDGAGFKPVNVDGITLDGGNNTVSNVYIDRPTGMRVGVFGYSEDSSVADITLQNVDITGNADVGALLGDATGSTIDNVTVSGASVTGDSNVGGLAGANDEGSITDSYATGSVDGDSEVGGLVGSIRQGSVENSYATGSVSSSGNAGGLVGYNDAGSIDNSYATGSVSGDGEHFGGLVGYNQGSITDSYATGSVIGYSQVGGLVGDNSSSVENSYATGSVDGADQLGGLVGYETTSSVSSSYWDTESTGQSSSAGGGTGLTTSEMQGSSAESNMSGFDFVDVWTTTSGGYPQLQN